MLTDAYGAAQAYEPIGIALHADSGEGDHLFRRRRPLAVAKRRGSRLAGERTGVWRPVQLLKLDRGQARGRATRPHSRRLSPFWCAKARTRQGERSSKNRVVAAPH